jgi:hypothetical protein
MWDIGDRKIFRAILFLSFLAFTFFIYLSAYRLTPAVTTIQSIYVFYNISLTGFLFYVWFGTLMMLVTLKGDGVHEKIKILWICVFFLVFSGLWVFLRPIIGLAGESPRHGAAINYVINNGDLKSFFYYYKDYPGTLILSSLISLICDIEALETLSLIVIFQIIYFPVIVFTLFNNVLKNYKVSLLAILILMNANINLDKLLIVFHPRVFALLPLITFLIICSKDPMFERKKSLLLSFILITMITITHLITSLLPLFIVLGINFLRRSKNWRELASLYSIITLFIIIPLAWLFFQAISWSHALFEQLYINIHKYFSEGLFSEHILNIGSTYFASPSWDAITRDLWLAILALSIALSLWNSVNYKKSNSNALFIKGSFLGLGMHATFIILISRTLEFSRFFDYLPLLSIPMLLSYTFNSKYKRTFVPILLTIMFVFSFPTFLAHNNSVGSITIYSYELHNGEFIRLMLDYRKAPAVFSANMFPVLFYHIPDISIETIYITSLNNSMNLLYNRLENSNFTLIVFNDNKIRSEFMRTFGIDIANYTRYNEYKMKLLRLDLIYSNFYEQNYISP